MFNLAINKYKRRLITLIAIQVLLTIIHKTQLGKFDETNWYYLSNWSYFAALFFGVFIVVYSLKLSCKSCGAGQVFRGFSAFSLRWPQDDCHKCGKAIK